MTVTINGTTGIDKVQDGSIQAADLASGVPSRSQLPAGTVLQVVTGTLSTTFSTTSSTFVSTGLTATITPTSATSKILALVSGGWLDSNVSTKQVLVTIYRNATNLGGANGLTLALSQSSRLQCPVAMQVYDSPATTSATTYTVYMYNGTDNTSISYGANGAPSTIVLMEIAA